MRCNYEFKRNAVELEESEYEESVRLRAENEYIKAEIGVIKIRVHIKVHPGRIQSAWQAGGTVPP